MAFTNGPAHQPHVCVQGGLEAIAFYEKAFGATNTFHPMADVFWGARYARVTDPCGHVSAFNAPGAQS